MPPDGIQGKSIKGYQEIKIVFMKIGVIGGNKLMTNQNTCNRDRKTKNKYKYKNQADHLKFNFILKIDK